MSDVGKTTSFTASLVVSGVSLAATAASFVLHKDALNLKGGIPIFLFAGSLMYVSSRFKNNLYDRMLPNYSDDVKKRAGTAFKIKIGVQALYCIMNAIAIMDPNITDNEFYVTGLALILNAAFTYGYLDKYRKNNTENNISSDEDGKLGNNEMRRALMSAAIQLVLFGGFQSCSVSYAGSVATILSPIISAAMKQLINK